MPMPPTNDSDLDRTDELPLLNLAVYEAPHAHADDVLSSTDNWATHELKDLLDAGTAQSAVPTDQGIAHWRNAKPVGAGNADLSVNVDGLLNRITELEATVASSHVAGAELEAQCESLRKQGSTLEQQLMAVESGYARLEEQRAASQELAQRLETQLHDQSEQHHAQLAEIQAAREAEQNQTQQERAVLERQIEQANANFSSTVDAHAQLKTALEESVALAAARAERIDELQQALADEETAAYTLGRNLAAKLADYDVLVASVAQRDATIAALERVHKELSQQLQQSAVQTSGEVERLTRELAKASNHHEEVTSVRGELAAKASELAQVTGQLTTSQADRATLWSELETQSNLIHTLQEDLASARQHNSMLEISRGEQQQAMDELQLQMAAQTATLTENSQLLNLRHDELNATKLALDQQTAEVGSLQQTLQARDALIENLRADIKFVQEERTAMGGHLSRARVRIKAMERRIVAADEQIETLKSDLAVHTEALASIRRDIERADGRQQHAVPTDAIDPVLEPLSHQGKPIHLSRRTMTVGRGEDNDIALNSKLISRHHARLVVGPNGVIVEDCGSTNGCFVNGQQVKQHVLHAGDVLTLGELKFRLGMQQATSDLNQHQAPA